MPHSTTVNWKVGLDTPLFLTAETLKVIFFGGKGGVGKSTCATSAALQIAAGSPEKTVLLLSTDPAHSIRAVLSDYKWPSNLIVRELDSVSALHSFRERNEATLKEIADRGTFLDKDDLEELMSLSMPGMDEVAAYLELSDLVNLGVYDRIIVDTAPTGHTLRLIEMPSLVERWLQALDTLLAKHRYIRRQFAKDNSLDHLDRFILSMSQSIKKLESILADPSLCNFVIVMLAETMSADETDDLIVALKKASVPVREVIVNRRLPINDCPVCQDGRHRQDEVLTKYWKKMHELMLWEVPWFPESPDAQRLTNVWQGATKCIEPRTEPSPAINLPTAVDNPRALSAIIRPVVIFAGKGGVGKTTMSCSTALRLSSEVEGKVLLISADPANSLSDCLGMKIGQKPTPVDSNLDAQELDANRLFKAIRDDYRDEIEGFLSEAMPNMDITFDREVMENLLDLAPSGLDEIMALSTLSDHVQSGKYEIIVLDSSPSGHMLRLLELPDILEAWFKQFFALLLKYKKVMRLPRISEQLVKFSRDLKMFKKLLEDQSKSVVVTVTQPTRVAIQKTKEMLDQLERLEMSIELVIVNQVTPASDCPLCAGLRVQETEVIKWFQSGIDIPMTLVARQSDPKGLEGLKVMGSHLYH